MSAKSKRNTPNRVLESQRERAIKTAVELHGQVKQLIEVNRQMQQDMARWIMLFMLQSEQHEVRFNESFLKKAEEWGLERSNDKDARQIVWRIKPRAEVESAAE